MKNLKICDNACGSGAFLIAAQQILLPIYWRCIKILLNKPFFREELSKMDKYRNWNYFLKREIITKNLYGVDIQEGAVEIAKLRLWLSMVSEMELKVEDIESLPNIDYNIMCGNSLIGFIEAPSKEQLIFELEEIKPEQRTITSPKEYQTKMKTETVKEIMKAKGILVNEYKRTKDSKRAEELKRNIEKINEKFRPSLNEKLLRKFRDKKIKIEREELEKLKPFHWGFEFYDVFDPKKPEEERGFDIIIGNPPYGNIFNKIEFMIVDKEYPFSASSKDASSIFIERSAAMLNKIGKFGMIVPLNILRIDKFYYIRKFLVEKVSPYLIADEGNPFKDQVELEMISVYYDLNYRDKINIVSKKPVKIRPKSININNIKEFDYRFIIYWDELFEKLIDNSKFKVLHVSQGVPRRADYKPNGKYLCLSAISLDPFIIKKDKIQESRKVTEKFVKDKNLQKQLEENLITPFSLGKTGKVTDLALECVLKPKGSLPDGTSIFIRVKENIDKKYMLLLLNSRLINHVTCRYLLSYGVRIFRNYIFDILPVKYDERNKDSFIYFSTILTFIFQFCYDNLESKKQENIELKKIRDFLYDISNFMVYELYFKEKFHEDGLYSEPREYLLELVSKNLKSINYDRWAELYWKKQLENDLIVEEEKELEKLEKENISIIKEVYNSLINDSEILEQIEKIKSHEWVKVIEGRQ